MASVIPPIRPRRSHARWAALPALCALVLATGSCADFSKQDETARQGTFTSLPEERPGARPAPPPPTTDDRPLPEGPCVDPNPAVIATCLASTSGIRPASPDGATTYVAERTTGNIIISQRLGPQRVIATVPVDASGDGGLIDFELSPSYAQDRLIYALISTPSDNRVVRIAPGNSVKPLLTGIPKGPTGNMGSLSFTAPELLIVATGNAGNPAAANDRSSLAGKILGINPRDPGAPPEIVASGFGSNVALCRNPANGVMYVADSGPAGDRVFELTDPGTRKIWEWTDRPGLAGCAVAENILAVSVVGGQRIDTMALPTEDNPAITEPTEMDIASDFGHVGRLTNAGSLMQLATVNKTTPGAEVLSYDDRVAVFPPIPPGGGGGND